MTRLGPVATGDSPRVILREQAVLEFDEGFKHLKARFASERDGVHGAVVRGLEVVVTGALAALGVRRRLRRDVDHLVDLALDVHGGADARAVARRRVHDVLRLRQMALFVRVKDPAFAPLLQGMEDLFTARLPDLARLATVEGARDFPGLVRAAFPRRADAEAVVTGNERAILEVMDHAIAHPHLVRVIPESWVPKGIAIGREFVTWQGRDARERLRAYYDGA